MRKRLVVLGLALLVVMLACGNKTDQDELNNANTLTTGVLGMMTNVDAYSGYSGAYPKPGLDAPPSGWTGPVVFNVPWSTADTLWYWTLKIPFTDSLGQDTAIVLMMLTPDIWDTLYDTCFVTKVDLAIWRLVNQDIYWHFNLLMEPTDTTHLSGSMTWNFHETWLDYDFTDIGIVPDDESGIIDVTTSDDIRLSAHFAFIADGSGTGTGSFQGFEFVRFTFFAEPDANGYKGYYTLASEDWKVEHYFPEHEET